MNSNQTNNDTNNSLSREDLETYRLSKDETIKHVFEKKAQGSDFENDALEGWGDKTLQSPDMSRLDKKFLSSNKWIYWTVSTFSLMAIIILFIYTNNQLNSKDTIATNQSKIVSIEKTDLVLPDRIEQMNELPAIEQISIKTIKKDFSNQQKEETFVNEAPVKVDELPLNKIEEPKPQFGIVKESVLGKEIYWHDLKLLDYRAYRSKSKITTKQMILTGTPANIGEEVLTEEEQIWKDIDIPYIDYLEKTIELFSKGQNKKALSRFAIILETYPDDLNGNFYAGLCYYNLKEYKSASNTFSKCLDSKYSNFNEEAEWYMAKSFLAAGNVTEGKVILKKIKSDGGYYAKQAEKILQ
jgi:tetratricopeptide (TPR) repeat protein